MESIKKALKIRIQRILKPQNEIKIIIFFGLFCNGIIPYTWDSNSAQSPSMRLQIKHYKLPKTAHIQNNMCCGRVNRCIKR